MRVVAVLLVRAVCPDPREAWGGPKESVLTTTRGPLLTARGCHGDTHPQSATRTNASTTTTAALAGEARAR